MLIMFNFQRKKFQQSLFCCFEIWRLINTITEPEFTETKLGSSLLKVVIYVFVEYIFVYNSAYIWWLESISAIQRRTKIQQQVDQHWWPNYAYPRYRNMQMGYGCNKINKCDDVNIYLFIQDDISNEKKKPLIILLMIWKCMHTEQVKAVQSWDSGVIVLTTIRVTVRKWHMIEISEEMGSL